MRLIEGISISSLYSSPVLIYVSIASFNASIPENEEGIARSTVNFFQSVTHSFTRCPWVFSITRSYEKYYCVQAQVAQ